MNSKSTSALSRVEFCLYEASKVEVLYFLPRKWFGSRGNPSETRRFSLLDCKKPGGTKKRNCCCLWRKCCIRSCEVMLFTHSFIDPTDCKDNGESGVSRSSPFCYCRKRRWVTMPLNLLDSVWIRVDRTEQVCGIDVEAQMMRWQEYLSRGDAVSRCGRERCCSERTRQNFNYKDGAKFEQNWRSDKCFSLDIIWCWM